MTYLVDSNWIILSLHGDTRAEDFLSSLIADGMAINTVIYMEVFQGLEREPDPPSVIAKFEALLDQIPIIPFSIEVAKRCAQVRETLKHQNRRVNSRALDLINATTAIEHNLIFVTQNMDDYKDLPEAVGLKLYQPAPPAEEPPAETDQEAGPGSS